MTVPLREVTDAEVARHLPLINLVLNRMRAAGHLSGRVEYEDLEAIGRWAIWEALRRYDPAKGAPSTYITRYIWGYLLDQQRKLTKADGHHWRDGQIATVISFDKQLADNLSLEAVLAAPGDMHEEVEHSAAMNAVQSRIAAMPSRMRTVAENVIAGNPRTFQDVGDELGVTRQRVAVLARRARAEIRSAWEAEVAA